MSTNECGYTHGSIFSERVNIIPMSDLERAAALKAEGNALLKAKKYPEAVVKYTEVWQANMDGIWGVCKCVRVCASV